MARYYAVVDSGWSLDETFGFLADLRNLASWDPGVVAVTQVRGLGAAAESEFDVTVRSVGRPLTLRYRTTVFEPSREVVVEATSSLFTSIDRITVAPGSGGAVQVVYDAELHLNGKLGAADFVLRPVFKRIGDRAAAGLARALDGVLVQR